MTQTQTRGPRLSPEAGRSPEAVAGVQQIMGTIYASGVPRPTLELVHMRASQINGCNPCIDYAVRSADTDELKRFAELPAFRESLLFDDAERAAVELTEAITRLADHPDVVSDEMWARAAAHYDEAGLAAIVSMAALTNFFNRVNTTLRVQPDSWE